MMTILDKANEYIGHPREVDEGYEVSMRRTAFEEGFKKMSGKSHYFSGGMKAN